MQQQILDAYPAVDLAVYAIWFPVLPTDDVEEWDGRLLADPRAIHFWDREQAVGRWFADEQNIDLGYDGEILWDAFVLFGPEAKWETAPAEPLVWGTPIIGRFPELAETLLPLLSEVTESASVPLQSALTAAIGKRTAPVGIGRREGARGNHA